MPDEDAMRKSKGTDYLLEDGVLKVNTGLNGEFFAMDGGIRDGAGEDGGV